MSDAIKIAERAAKLLDSYTDLPEYDIDTAAEVIRQVIAPIVEAATRVVDETKDDDKGLQFSLGAVDELRSALYQASLETGEE